MLIAGFLLLIAANVLLLILFYRLWRFTIDKSQQNGLVPSINSPAKAVGFLFIPLFALYWVFKVFAQLPKNLNAIAKNQDITHVMPEGLGLFIAIMSVIGIVPYVGYVTTIISVFILMPVFVSQCINTCDQIENESEDEKRGAIDYTATVD